MFKYEEFYDEEAYDRAGSAQDDADFLRWVHQRLVRIYKENPNVDYLRKLRAIIGKIEHSLYFFHN